MEIDPVISELTIREKILVDFSQLSGKIGLFGGSFDPIHIHHLAIAQELRDSCLDAVVFIPAAQNPLKSHRPVADADRVAMILLAIRDLAGCFVSPIELQRGRISYTVDTLRDITAQCRSGSELFWIIGSDCLDDLAAWREVDRIFRYVRVLTVQRDRDISLSAWHEKISALPLSNEIRLQLQQDFCPRIANDVSSRKIRTQLSGSIDDGAVPAEVADYIHRKKLYEAVA